MFLAGLIFGLHPGWNSHQVGHYFKRKLGLSTATDLISFQKFRNQLFIKRTRSKGPVFVQKRKECPQLMMCLDLKHFVFASRFSGFCNIHDP